MRAVITFTDDEGNTWEHELTLVSRGNRGDTSKRLGKNRTVAVRTLKSRETRATQMSDPDFSLPLRPFIKRYAAGASGPRKFAILVARMANGDLKTEIAISEIEGRWNRMTALMGGPFNGAHATRAKDHGWVDSPKHGVYKLLDGWRGALPLG
jgi:hypothetical protein